MVLQPEDSSDFDSASYGLKLSLNPCQIPSKRDNNVLAWDNDAYGQFINRDCPPEVNQSLWRQSQLCYKQGLFEAIPEKIYQVRGLDISNMTFVETISNNGVIVIDCLTSVECAEKAIQLYQQFRPNKKIRALIYTHSHADHFGGASAVVDAAGENLLGIYAPEGFFNHAVSENVYAGNAMMRRAVYMYGQSLPKAITGQVGSGLGMTTSAGISSMIVPTVTIYTTGETHTIDDLDIVFQVTPGTEAPSEMNFHFPAYKALCMAENACHTMHNIQTLRGALVRDARLWSRYLDESILLYGAKSDVVFASHHWPTFGNSSVIKFLSQQRDLYAYLHNETLRRLNNGETGIEIAEDFQLPPTLDRTWNARGYYGSVSHNVKAIYNRYMGWFDGNPAHLWEHPPVAIATRYVDCMGGIEAVIDKALEYAKKQPPDLRFAATLLSHAVFSDQTNIRAKAELSKVFTRLGYGAENGTWRNFYLCGAQELTDGIQGAMNSMSPKSMMALSIEELLDTVAIRVTGPNAWDTIFTMEIMVKDLDNCGWHINMSNGVMTDHAIDYSEEANADVLLTFWPTHIQLVELVLGVRKTLDKIKSSGDVSLWTGLHELLEPLDPAFAIVTPEK